MLRCHKKTPILLCLILLLSALLWAPAFATTIQDLDVAAEASDDPLQTYREQLQAIKDSMDSVKNNISAQKDLVSGLQTEIAAIDSQLITVQAQLELAEKSIVECEAQIAVCDANIADAEVREAERQAYLEARLVALYVNGDINILDVVFETSSFEDFLTVVDMTELLMAQDRSLVEEIQAERKLIEETKAELEVYKESLVELKNDYYDQVSDLKRLEEQKAAAMNEANMTLAEYEAYYASLNSTAEAAGDKIRELLANSDSTLSFGGYMIWPCQSQYTEVTSPYGWREHPVYGGQRFHSGIDIGASGGSPIFAAADGKIILEEYYGGYGYCIMIDHGNGIVSLYGHQSAFGDFGVGDYVVQGDVIGYVGTTGTSTGNHLHFEVRVNGEYTSPWDYLR